MKTVFISILFIVLTFKVYSQDTSKTTIGLSLGILGGINDGLLSQKYTDDLYNKSLGIKPNVGAQLAIRIRQGAFSPSFVFMYLNTNTYFTHTSYWNGTGMHPVIYEEKDTIFKVLNILNTQFQFGLNYKNFRLNLGIGGVIPINTNSNSSSQNYKVPAFPIVFLGIEYRLKKIKSYIFIYATKGLDYHYDMINLGFAKEIKLKKQK